MTPNTPISSIVSSAFHPNVHLGKALNEQRLNPEHLTKVITTRVTIAQYMLLLDSARALSMPLSHYIRALVIDDKAQRKLVRFANTKQQRIDAATILSKLGETRISNNLNALAKGLHTGNLIFTPDVVAQINKTYEMIMEIRHELILIQGLKP